MEWMRVGDVIFIVGSLIVFVFSAMAVKETRFREIRFDDHDRNEFLECMMYAVSAIIFFVGSFFYFPGIYGSDKQLMIKGQIAGAILFVIGSLGFACASFFNAMGMATESKDHADNKGYRKIHLYHAFAVFNSLFGAVMFVVGSMLYRVATRFCMEIEIDTVKFDERLEQACTETELSGTILYIIGSTMFVAEAILNYICMHLKRDLEEELDLNSPKVKHGGYSPVDTTDYDDDTVRVRSNEVAQNNGKSWIELQGSHARDYSPAASTDYEESEGDEHCC